ncbi:MAG: hypothetical protein L6V95_11215 [Candidatus Melainabacteria bacterium]|nr:MAG: hypothetical protein L6V95_11215 [Candidatus Melainabacteria bacterium]
MTSEYNKCHKPSWPVKSFIEDKSLTKLKYSSIKMGDRVKMTSEYNKCHKPSWPVKSFIEDKSLTKLKYSSIKMGDRVKNDK